MRRAVFFTVAFWGLIGILFTFSARSEMVITLKNGQQVRLPYTRNDVARIDYTDSSAVAADGIPWVVNSNGHIFRRAGGSWQQLPGLAKDIGIGAGGSAWVIGTDPCPGGFGIYFWNGTNWSRVDGGAARIAVAPDGNPWVVNAYGNIFRRAGGAWQQLSGLAKDIGIGANGSAWVIGTDSVPGGFGIYFWNGTNWSRVDGGAARIAVAPDGNPWVVNAFGNIFRRAGSGWQQLPGLAKDIGIGPNGSVWITGTDPVPGGFGIYFWNGSDWSRVDGGGVSISVQ